jgi:transposase
MGFCVIGLACLATVVGVLDTRRACTLVFDQACDGPHWRDALLAFGIAAALLGAGMTLIVRLRRTGTDRTDR